MKTEQPNPKQAGQGLPEKLQLAHGMICYTDHDMEPITDRDAVPIIDLGIAAELVRRWNQYDTHIDAIKRAWEVIRNRGKDGELAEELYELWNRK